MLRILIIILSLMVIGCGESARTEIKIVTTVYPLYLEVTNITRGVDSVEVVLLNEKAGCLHEYQLTPGDMQLISDADILVVNGLGLEPFDIKSARRVINASEGLNAEEHAWLSITKTIKQVEKICAALSEYDADHAEIYKRNALEYVNDLTTLRDEAQISLSILKNRQIIATHGFDCLAEEFNLEIVDTIEEITPARRVELINELNKMDKKIICADEVTPAIESIAKESSAQIIKLDMITKPGGGYIERMLNNITALLKGLN